MCKMPYGISDFQLIRSEKYMYIDKTKFIEVLEKDKSYVHFLRPRRFGKSLFTSMLGYYYDINMKDKFDALFGPCPPLAEGTYIHGHPTKERNTYYILNLNFSGLTGKYGKELEHDFTDKVKEAIENCIKNYHLPVSVREDLSAARMLSRFLSDVFYSDRKEPIYVIIDEL